MTTIEELARGLSEATGPSRELDRAIGFAIGLGVEKERKLYVEMGAAMWVPAPDLRGLTPYDHARGSSIRTEWVKGSRGRKGHYKEVRWGACDGPMPLTDSPLFTASIDAAMTLAALPELRQLSGQSGILREAMSDLNKRFALHMQFWPDDQDYTQWLARFVAAAALRARAHLTKGHTNGG